MVCLKKFAGHVFMLVAAFHLFEASEVTEEEEVMIDEEPLGCKHGGHVYEPGVTIMHNACTIIQCKLLDGRPEKIEEDLGCTQQQAAALSSEHDTKGPTLTHCTYNGEKYAVNTFILNTHDKDAGTYRTIRCEADGSIRERKGYCKEKIHGKEHGCLEKDRI